VTAIKLRDYQREAIDAVFAAWAGGMQRPAIVLPTGAGKTVVFASLIKEFREQQAQPLRARSFERGNRVIVLAHRDELVDQAIAKIRAIAPDLNVGKVKAGDNDVYADVMVCSVQTLVSVHRRNSIRSHQDVYGSVGLIITDECHHAAAVSYKKIYDAFPDALQLGVTATMARGDGVGLGSVWEDVVYRRSILNLISKGHLTDVRTVRVDLKELDMGAVGVSRGDWQAGDLGRALMESEADTAIARAYRDHAGDRQGIVFTPTVETAYAACKSLRESGIRSTVVDGETPVQVRREAYEQFRKGHTQVLVNCMVLTEGFDAPWAQVAVIARPTRNAALYTQMVGRVLRPWPDKTEALVLDLVGASANRLRTLIDLEPGAVKELRDGESLAEAVVREAEEGNRTVPAGSVAFELKARDVDSFAASGIAWVRSPGGVMFINCGEHRVFLWPSKADTGTWDVGVVKAGERAQQTPYRSLSLGEAMAWGEAVSEDYAAFSVAKTARWRTGKPSDAQLGYAATLGVAGAEDMTRGELSTAIDRIVGGRLFDSYLGKG
jgi:superfamily II DNA or RNA helicase